MMPQHSNQSGTHESVLQIWLMSPAVVSLVQETRVKKRPEALQDL